MRVVCYELAEIQLAGSGRFILQETAKIHTFFILGKGVLCTPKHLCFCDIGCFNSFLCIPCDMGNEN